MLEKIISSGKMLIAGLALLGGCATAPQLHSYGVTETAKKVTIVGCGDPGADSHMGWNGAEEDARQISGEYFGKPVFMGNPRHFYNPENGCYCLEYTITKPEEK